MRRAGGPRRGGALALTVSLVVALAALPAPPAVAEACPFPMPNDPVYEVTEDNVVYRVVDGVEITLDVYVPDAARPSPAVVVVHGGAWRSGCKEKVQLEADYLRDRGFVVFAPDHRLSCTRPAVHYLCGHHAPAPVEDIHEVVRWVREHGHDHWVDLSRGVGVLGLSSGGHLGFMAAVTGRSGEDRPDVAVGWSPATHLEVEDATGARLQYVGASFEEHPDLWHTASPYHHLDRRDRSPQLLFGTRLDPLVPRQEIQQYARRLAALGLEGEAHLLPGRKHGSAYAFDPCWCDPADPALTVIDRTAAFLAAHLGSGTEPGGTGPR